MNHIKTLSCQFYSTGNSNQYSQAEYLKYLVVDSENEDQQIYKRDKQSKITPQNKFVTTTPMTNTPVYLSNKNSRVIKHKSTLVSHVANSSYPFSSCQESNVDQQIRKAQAEVNNLSKECALLQKLIEDMTKQQAEIKIQLRIKERQRKLHQQMSLQLKKECPLHNKNVQISKNSSNYQSIWSENHPLSNIKYSQNIVVQQKVNSLLPSRISSTMLLSNQLSPNKETLSKYPSKEIKASSLRISHKKVQQNKENMVSKKITQRKKQPWHSSFKKKKSESKTKNKQNQRSISKNKKRL